MGLTDIGRYFHTFPLSLEARRYLTVSFQRSDYYYARCAFGYKLCPYYCSTCAEFRSWFLAMNLPVAHMVDDWITVGDTPTLNIDRIEEVLTDCGFYISDKRRFGQREVALGVLIDTIHMTISFDPIQSQGIRIMLQQQLHHFLEGKPPDHTIVRHLCGKLNWFAEALQSGRLHLRSWWLYQRFGQQLSPHHKILFQDDTNWWISILEKWERSDISKLTFKIWSSDELLDPSAKIFVIQSDASGPDGIGYHSGFIDELQHHFYSAQWDSLPSSSHEGELRALLIALNHLSTVLEELVVVWVSDSQSAVASINNPRPKVDSTFFPVLSNIYNICDENRLSLLALWVPREDNTYADYLSHLSVLLDRQEVSGTIQVHTPSAVGERSSRKTIY
jgi:ribonuclease HI